MRYTIAAAVNDEAVLQSSLLSSPELEKWAEIVLRRGCVSASAACNEALEMATGEIVIFVHQDVFLPAGWFARLESAIQWLDVTDSNWGVLGIYGMTADRQGRGWVYSTGLGARLGGPFPVPHEVRTLDEVVLVIRRSSGLRFDEHLPGFHMYGTDICLRAESRGCRNYVVPCFAIHNSNGIRNLPPAFWQACQYVRRKWRDRLPVCAPCTTLDRSALRSAIKRIRQLFYANLQRQTAGSRVADPSALYWQLETKGLGQSLTSFQE